MIENYPFDIIDDNIILRFPKIKDDDDLPHISILTITHNRPEFYALMIRNITTCDYPKHLIEWVVIEDGSSMFDYSTVSGISIKYFHLGNLHFPIGYKRNIAVKKASHDILVHIDDDDYYPPESVLARVRALYKSNFSCIGCLKVRTFHLFTERTYEAFESSDINMSESSLTYTRSFWNARPFENKQSFAEGISFLKNRYIECRSLPHIFIIVQFDHSKNTVIRQLHSNAYDHHYSVLFLSTVDNETKQFIYTLRDRIVQCMPETKEIVSFIKMHNNSMEKSSKYLHTLPYNLQRHPLSLELCKRYPHYQSKKKIKDKIIVMYCGSGEKMMFTKYWDYDNTQNIGGSEESILNLAKFLSTSYVIHIYNERDDVKHFQNGRISFFPWYTFRQLNKIHVFISWRDCTHFEMFPSLNTTMRVLDLHDCIHKSWISEKLPIDFIFVKSNFHYEHCINDEIKSKVIIVPNGIDLIHEPLSKKEHIVLCTSSPERCWVSFFRLAEDFASIDPNLRFVHCYDINEVQKSPYWSSLVHLLENNKYVQLTGHLPLNEINEMYKKARLFVYPTRFCEIDCISLSKAIKSKCLCIHTSAGAMLEKSLKYNTYCVQVQSAKQEDNSFALNEEEYVEFKNMVLHVLKEPCFVQDYEIPTVEDTSNIWKLHLNTKNN